MPIKKALRPATLIATAALLVAAGPPSAMAATTPPTVPPIDEASCHHPDLSQPMSIFGDFNNYGLAPGGMFNDVTGWQLAREEQILTTT